MWHCDKLFFLRYTHSSSSSSPEVVYCSQLKCKTATAASAGRTASSMPSSDSSYLPNHLRHLEINSKNGRIVRHLADMHRATEMNKRVQSHGITADAPVDDSSDDDLLANNIEESSDEEDDQSIKELELRKASNKRTSFYARLDSKQQKNKVRITICRYECPLNEGPKHLQTFALNFCKCFKYAVEEQLN